MVVATKLLARRNLIDTGKQFNMIAAAWIQFMIHDWIDHLEDTQQIELTAPREVANECPLKSFKFYKTKELKRPDPMVVATKLLARRNLIDTGKQFNMIAAAWIQFMIHDWIDHLEDTQQIELTAPREVANECPLKSFKFYKTKEVPTCFYEIKSGFLNTRTPWWDGSAIYGSNAERLQKVRTFRDGKLKIGIDGLLLRDHDGYVISGDIRNSWAGLSTLQALFVHEHNAVCDALKVINHEELNAFTFIFGC
ncbi:unnamed protein product [Ilex paraguariensis]|uniref:Uncharacterized protein n=1 Tax=Ilex paraguariensis TaxID=185542 RepID=A0ABC8SVZ5_9AQUA